MVRKYKAKKRISNRLLYTLVAIGIFALIGIGVNAFGTTSPSTTGHSAGEVDLSGGVSGNAVFKGNISVAGEVNATNVRANTIYGDGSGVTNVFVKVRGGPTYNTCNSANDGLVRYQGAICVRDDFKASSVDICMKTSSSIYSWSNLKYFEWQDTACDFNGCPPGQWYYECSNPSVSSGCYGSEPYGCYGYGDCGTAITCEPF